VGRRLAGRVLLDDQPEFGPDARGRGVSFGSDGRGSVVERGPNPIGGGQQQRQYQHERWHRSGHCRERSVTAFGVVEAFRMTWRR